MYQKTVLKNGMRLLAVPSRDTEAMTLLVVVGVGSWYESSKLAGASHFIEHMLFKGTKKRPTAKKISRDLDAVGADYNAFTGKEYTGFYIRLHADRSKLAVDMLYEMLFESLFNDAEVERERGVILEEIKMYEDNPAALAGEMLDELIYHGCPLGRNIAGHKKTVSTLGRKELVGFWKKNYIPSNIVVAAAGRIDDNILKYISKKFSAKRASKKRSSSFRCADLKGSRKRTAIKYKETEQLQLAIGFPAFSYGHKFQPALTVMSTILGGGMSSRLFTEVREKRGLAYSVHTGAVSYKDTGEFSVQAGLNSDKAKEGIKTILKELGKMARSGPSDEELKRAKEFIRGRIILGLENSSELAEFYAKQELLHGKIETADKKIDRLFKVSAEKVKQVARSVIKNSKLSVAMVGPNSDIKSFQKLLNIPYV